VEVLGDLNVAIFLWINQDGGHHYRWLDALMMFLSDARNGVIPFVLVAAFAFWRSGRVAWRVVAAMVLLVLLSDWSGAQIKHWVAMERPCDALSEVRLLAPYCGRNSFPSNHAMNMAAVATLLGWHYRILIAPMGFLAVMVGISRIYVGVHYPADVLFGWVWGVVFASAFYWIGWHYLPWLYQQRWKQYRAVGKDRED
jgi:undecaprenyl-diphosphatase